jgi:CHAT domain-containing protein
MRFPLSLSLSVAVLFAGGISRPFTVTSSTQQSPSVTAANASEIDAWLREADGFVREEQPGRANPLFERALAAAQALGLQEQEAHAHCGVAESLLGLARYADARAAGLRCLEMSERLQSEQGIGRASLALAAVAFYLNGYESGRAYAERAAAAFEATGNRRGRALATLHLLGAWRGSQEEQWRLFRRVSDDAHAAGDKKTEARAMHTWGDHLFAAGLYEESLEKLEAAAALFEAVNARVALGTVFNSLGRLYRVHGRFDEALRFQLRALSIHETANSPFALLQSTNAVGAVYASMGEAAKSKEFYERALALAEKTVSQRIQDFVRANLAGTLIEQGEFAHAARILEEVIAHGLDAYPTLRYSRLAYARLHMGQIPEALAAAERAVEHCGNRALDCISARYGRAAAYAASANEAAALEDLRTALTLIEEQRTTLVPADFFKQNFHRTQEDVYSQAIAIQLRQHHEREALETAEKARARAFLDLLASRSLQAAAPAAVGDVSSLAARLGSTFLFYWVAEDGMYVWTVSPDGRTRARKVTVLRSRLLELIRAATPRLDAPTARPEKWRELYDLLIAPIRDGLPRAPGALLTIVPHGPLLTLSFAALQDPRGRYLIEDFTLHYVPAAAVLQFTTADEPTAARKGEVLIVADPPLPAQSRFDRKLPRLPGARIEAAGIGKLLPRSRQTLLQGAAATESTIRERIRGKSVVHFATHAVVRDDTPFSSFLAVGPTAAEAAADGLLTAEEIYKLDLDAGLVVLSACRSADGPVTGDGIATFARAFMSAGTPSLVASLWGVADQPTDRLLPEFYRAWLSGQSKASAMRTAQLRLLRDLRANSVRVETPVGIVPIREHPVFWAGFSLIGDPR